MLRLPVLLAALGLASVAYAAQPVPEPPAAAAVPSDPAPFVLKDTEVRTIRARTLQRDYEIYVSLPASYHASPRRRFPVLFITDADYAFPLVRSIARRVGNRGQGLEEFILVGISYAVGDTPQFSRRRDYTPTPNGEKTKDESGRAPVFGEAEPYRRFLADELMPFVASTYRTDTHRSIFAGHSYGGLLGLHILLTEPKMFSHYIIGSPSLWFDQRVMFARERAYAEANKELKADVLMAIASFETIGKASPRYSSKLDMIAELQEFEKALRSRNYPGLRLTTEIIQDEDHLTVFPAIITRGLMWALPAKRS
ncbi:putative esterase precursor [Bosea sp. LC85]|uniref:alpha/beta hydrolase n=1 Tax=Bosea sp. LC85 TaxID=1502851 RepID=UPI0004E2E950|nr:alpha/beta hydrolase-fold protein [Bosea sp. LC85]KFC63576.1 putative esterase precursor [Bosea sp. LC85]